nr:energy transducer TonB [Prevotella sp.]
MEIKKSNYADLENKRATSFLLGLILALSLLFAGFQYTSHPKDMDADEDDLDNLTQDLEMSPVNEKDMISAEPAAPSSKSITDMVRAVDHTVDQPDKVNPNSNPLLVGDGTGAVDKADVTEALPQTPADIDQKPVDYHVVEQMPEFPGGWVELMKWLQKNLKYPYLAQQQKIQGEVVVTFIINKDGSIANIRLAKSVNPFLDREALRVIHMMPKWKPGMENDKVCRTMMAIPVAFSL